MNQKSLAALNEIGGVVRRIDSCNEVLDRLMRSVYLSAHQRREIGIQSDRLDRVAHVLAEMTQHATRVNR